MLHSSIHLAHMSATGFECFALEMCSCNNHCLMVHYREQSISHPCLLFHAGETMRFQEAIYWARHRNILTTLENIFIRATWGFMFWSWKLHIMKYEPKSCLRRWERWWDNVQSGLAIANLETCCVRRPSRTYYDELIVSMNRTNEKRIPKMLKTNSWRRNLKSFSC